MNRDQRQNELLKVFYNTGNKTWNKRVQYQKNLNGLSNLKVPTVVIIDECDAIIFKDLLKFYKATKNLKIIGLTATAFDKKEDGAEIGALGKLDFRVYKTTHDDETRKPTIHENMRLGSFEKYAGQIGLRRLLQPVLVYAKGSLYNELASGILQIKKVTEQTSD